jgi:hypothetical protein
VPELVVTKVSEPATGARLEAGQQVDYTLTFDNLLGQAAADVLSLEASRLDPLPVSAVKGSLKMLPVLRRLVSLPLVDGPAGALRVSVKGEILTLNPAELARIRRDVLARMPANTGRGVAEDALITSLYAKLPDDVEVTEAQLTDIVTSTASYRMFIRAWWPDLTPTEVLSRLADRRVVAAVAQGVFDEDEQALLARSYAEEEWSVADIALLDELAALLGPVTVEDDEPDGLVFLPKGANVTELVTTADILDELPAEQDDDPLRTYLHVLVDEAQDLSPMQWRMLRRRGPQASWTIVGDPAQSSWPNPAETRKSMSDLIGSSEYREFTLTKNYRSPAEVFELASTLIRSVFPGAELPEAVRRTGVEPELTVSSRPGLAEAVAGHLGRLAGEVEGTIGVIAAPPYHAELAGLGRTAGAQAAGERWSLLTPHESKGLEFDAVIVIDPDGIVDGTAAGVRLLYVCLTRPTQRLVTIDIDQTGYWQGVLG